MRPDIAFAAALLLAGPAVHAGSRHQDVVETRDLEETFPLPGGPGSHLVIDNVFGSISVVGSDRPDVRMTARETFRAVSDAAMQRARRDVRLAIDHDERGVRIVVDGPFRRADGGIDWNGRLGYTAVYDFEIEAPANVDLAVETINEGRIEIKNVSGRFAVSNVNGGVTMREVRGAGEATTVNGAVEVDFAARPDGPCRFETVNGDIRTRFPADLAADLDLQTFHGEVYTDFDYAQRPMAAAQPRRENGRFHLESRGFGARIGAGGPVLSFETLNGDILIRNRNHAQ